MMEDGRPGAERFGSFLIGIVDRVVFVRWMAQPQAADGDALATQVSLACKRLGGSPIVCLVLDGAIGPPSAELRARSGEILTRVRQNASAVHMVVVGSGVTRSLLRTVMRGVLIAARQASYIRIHDDVDDVLTLERSHLGLEPPAVLAEARRRGLVP